MSSENKDDDIQRDITNEVKDCSWR